MRHARSLLLLYLVATLSRLVVQGAVMSIDYGSEWFKVALVEPGVPMDLVLNPEAKRKTHALVTLRSKDEILFGNDAASVAARFPTATFPNLKVLLGKQVNTTAFQDYRKRYSHEHRVHDRRFTPEFVVDDRSYGVEELVAMQLMHARELAELKSKSAISQAVLTIPPFFTDSERRALWHAAELAGLKVATLLHEETAVAINYAMTRQFPKPQQHIFYDMGAGSTVASLIQFQSEGKGVKIQVLHTAYDAHLGGSNMDALIVDRLVKWFSEKHPQVSPILDNPRAVAKLYKEAARVKIILSVNAQATASIEGVHEDLDLRVLIQRADFEADMAALIPRMSSPLEATLKAAGGKEKVESLILVGGSVRVPLVQRTLEEMMGGADKIAKNVNGDEAVVLGAAFHAAGRSMEFRVRSIQVHEALPYTIQINGSDLFKAHSPILGTSKSVTLKKPNPLKFFLTQAMGEEKVPLALAITNGTESYIEQKLFFKLDENGYLYVSNATGVYTVSSGLLGLSSTNASSPLGVTWIPHFATLNTQEREEIQKRLTEWKEAEKRRLKYERTRNTLESLVYEIRDKVDDSSMKKICKADELSAVQAAADTVGQWLDESEGDLSELESKHATLKAHFSQLTERLREFRSLMAELRDFHAELGTNATWVDEYSARDVWELQDVLTYHKGVKQEVEALRAKLEKERLEREAKAKAEREAKAKALRELQEKLAKEKAEREAKEKAAAQAANATLVENQSGNTTAPIEPQLTKTDDAASAPAPGSGPVTDPKAEPSDAPSRNTAEEPGELKTDPVAHPEL